MSRFSGRTDEPQTDEIDVNAKAFLALTLYLNGAQRVTSKFLLVTDSRSEAGANGPAETLVCVDGVTGEKIEITVSYPSE